MLWKLLAVALLTLGLTTAIACGDDDDDGGATDEPTLAETTAPAGETDAPTDEPTDAEIDAPTETAAATETPDEGQPLTFELDAADFSFSRSTISAPADTEVAIDFSNIGQAPHTFTVADLSIDEQLSAGESTTITFTMPDSLTEFLCTVHPSLMTGTLQPVDGDSAANPEEGQDPAAFNTRY